MKKVLLFISILVLSIGMFGCKDKDKKPTPGPNVELDKELAAEFNGLAKDTLVYLTTVGQSDLALAQNVLKLAGFETKNEDYVSSNTLTVSDIDTSGSKTPVVFLVVGGSSKGLGAAGTDITKETARGTTFAETAEAGTIKLVVLHLGGAARRGTLTDPILDAVCGSADLMLVVNGGNEDGYFTNSANSNSVPLNLYSTSAKIVPAIKTLFGAE